MWLRFLPLCDVCTIFAWSFLMLHVISCCTTPVTGISLLHLPCGHFALASLWFCWIVGPPPGWLWPIFWVECWFFHSVTMSLFVGGLWVLNQRGRDLFIFTFLVDNGSFNTGEKHVPWWYLQRSFSSMTMICFIGWNVGPSLVWPWSISWWTLGPSPIRPWFVFLSGPWFLP